MDPLVALAIAGPVLLYQLYVNRLVIVSRDYSRQQRIYQSLLIWIMPIVGAVLCHCVLRAAGTNHRKSALQGSAEGISLEDDPLYGVRTRSIGSLGRGYELDSQSDGEVEE
jgi:hypothetical protein